MFVVHNRLLYFLNSSVASIPFLLLLVHMIYSCFSVFLNLAHTVIAEVVVVELQVGVGILQKVYKATYVAGKVLT